MVNLAPNVMDTASLLAWIREKGGRPGDFVWAPHARDVWALAHVVARIDDAADRLAPPTLELEFADGTRPSPAPLPLARTQEFDAAHVAHGCADVAQVNNLNDAPLLDIVRRRFVEDLIYTRASNVLISVNPFAAIAGLYDLPASVPPPPPPSAEAAGAGAAALPPRRPPPPHVFSVAEAAFCAMLGGAQDQSVVVNGESGAGKTEACKKLLYYLSRRARLGGADAVVLRACATDADAASCLLYTSPSPRDGLLSRMPSSA